MTKQYREELEVMSRAEFDEWIEALREAFRAPTWEFPSEIRTLADCFQPLNQLQLQRGFRARLTSDFELRLELEVVSGAEVSLTIRNL